MALYYVPHALVIEAENAEEAAARADAMLGALTSLRIEDLDGSSRPDGHASVTLASKDWVEKTQEWVLTKDGPEVREAKD